MTCVATVICPILLVRVLCYNTATIYFVIILLLSTSGLRVCNRDVAIDYCMGKGVYERTNAEGEVIEGDGEEEEKEGDMRLENDEGEEDGEGAEEDDGDNDEGEGDEDDEDGGNDEDEAEDEDEDEDEEEEEKGGKKTKKEENDLDDVVEGCTVFLRDLPYDADHRDLRKVIPLASKLLYSLHTIKTLSQPTFSMHPLTAS